MVDRLPSYLTWLLPLAFALGVLVLARPAGAAPYAPHPDAVDANAAAYMQSPAPGETFGLVLTSGGAGDCRPITIHGYYTDTLVLFTWGKQLNFVNESASAATFYEMQTRESTVADGLNAGAVTFDSANSCTSGTAGPGGNAQACRAMGTSLSGTGYTQVKISRSNWLPGMCAAGLSAANRLPPTCRRGRCSVATTIASGPMPAVGGPCNTNAECGTSGTCDLTTPPDGVYACVLSQAVAGNIKIQTARQ